MDPDEERMLALIESYDSDLDEDRFEQLNQEEDESQDEGDGGDQQAHDARSPGQVQHSQENKCEREGHLDSAKAESNRPNHGEALEGKEQQSERDGQSDSAKAESNWPDQQSDETPRYAPPKEEITNANYTPGSRKGKRRARPPHSTSG